jgi:hypothetical protein
MYAGCVALSALLSASCYPSSVTTCGQEDEPLVVLRGTTRDARTQAPLANVHVFAEVCGRYTENPNPAVGHPNYRYGGVSDKAGNYEFLVPNGPVGLHSFKPYYQYGTVLTEVISGPVNVPMEPNPDRPDPVPVEGTTAECLTLAERCGKCALGPLHTSCLEVVKANNAVACTTDAADKKYEACTGRTAVARPVLSAFAAKVTTVAPGAPVQFTLTARADRKDPLSEEVLLLQPDTQVARAFDPPVRGIQAIGFANGTWKLTVPAPSKPGIYKYFASVSSEQCVTGLGEPMTTPSGSPQLNLDRTPMREQPSVTITVK